MDELAFHKMHSLGNDFVIIDRRSGKLSLSGAQIRKIADRRHGVGCDQLLSLEPSQKADLFMRVHNPDGSEAEACGNGTRCVARLIMEQHMTNRARIETRADVLAVTAGVQGYTVDMGRPRFGWDEIPLAQAMDTLKLDLGSARSPGQSRSAWAIRTPCSWSTTSRRSRSSNSGPSWSITRCFRSAPTSGSPRCAMRARSGCGSGSAALG
jgi:diaminopimelate epimerase